MNKTLKVGIKLVLAGTFQLSHYYLQKLKEEKSKENIKNVVNESPIYNCLYNDYLLVQT